MLDPDNPAHEDAALAVLNEMLDSARRKVMELVGDDFLIIRIRLQETAAEFQVLEFVDLVHVVVAPLRQFSRPYSNQPFPPSWQKMQRDCDWLKTRKVFWPSRKIELYSAVRGKVPAMCRRKGFKDGSTIFQPSQGPF